MTAPGPHQNERALSGVARGGTVALGGTVFAAALGFGLTFIVTRGLSADVAGQFFTVMAIYFVLQTLVAFGVAAGVVRFVPRFRALGRTGDLPRLLIVAIAPVAGFAAVASVALWVVAPRLSTVFDASDPSSTVVAFRLLALFLVPGVLEVALVEGTRAFRSITGYVLIQQVVLPLGRAVAVLVAVAGGSSLVGVVLAWLLPVILTLVLAGGLFYFSVRGARADGWPPPTESWGGIASEYWSFTVARGLSGAIDIALTWLDVLMVAAMVSAADAAVYAAASRFVTTGTLALQAMRLAAAPEISAALARDDRAHASALYRVTTQWVVLSSWPLYLLLAIFAPWILGLFGPGYDRGAPALAVLSLSMLVALAAGNVGSVLLMGGRSTWVLADKAIVLAVNLVLNLLLIPYFGIVGAAAAWAVAIVVDNGLALLQVHLGMRVTSRGPGMVRAMLYAAVCFGGIALAVRFLLGPTFPGLLIAIIVGLAVYAALVWRSRKDLELALLRGAVGLRPRLT